MVLKMEDRTYATPYEQALEAIIPLAELTANRAVGPFGDPDKWNQVYHSTMDRLATARGIRRQSWQS